MKHRSTSLRLAAALIIGGVAVTAPLQGLAESTKPASPAESKPKAKPKKPSVKAVNNAHCPVTGSAIGSMGEGTSATYKGYKVSLCCNGCANKFNANPDAYLQAALADTKRQ